ncbi:MAG TPA: FtsQ-type POTRA domain-containing protein [Candidatus Dormibacteraeota bacterium]|nr:FtsQ-type POTRA domain-containing protein [Candidatus Dormibacteraeota bacterium]
MRFRRRRSLLPRIGRRPSPEEAAPLKGQLWTRSEQNLREPDVNPLRRAAAVVVAVAEFALLGWLWFGPALAVKSVAITGAHHLTPAQVEATARLSGSGSIISVDGEWGRQQLLNQVWVRTAQVDPHMDGTVVVRISEWQPVAAYHSGTAKKYFLLSSQAMVLGPAPSAGSLVDVQGPAGADPKIGTQAIDPTLLVALVNMQRGFPTLIGQEVASFIFDSCGDLTLLAKRGWKVYFGRVLTPEEFATLRDKLAALKAIAGHGNVDYSSVDLEYVNVMNPAEPAAGYKAREPATPSPAPGAPQPSPSPMPQCK